MSSFTAFEKQYWEIKQKYWDTIVFFKKDTPCGWEEGWSCCAMVEAWVWRTENWIG